MICVWVHSVECYFFYVNNEALKRIFFGYHIFRQTQSIRVLEAQDED